MTLTKATYSMIDGAEFNVKDFGAVGNNTADDTAAFQAALNAINANGGGCLRIPKGAYKLTATLTYPNARLKITGDGPTTSVLKPTNTSTNMLTISGNWITLTDFSVEPVGTFTAGYVFEFTTTSGNINIYNVTTFGGYNIVGFTGVNAAQTYIIGCTFNNFRNHGIQYGAGYGGFGVLSSLNLNNSGDANQGYGIYCQSGDTFTWENINIQACKVGVYIRSASGSFVRNVFATNVLADGVGRTAGEPGWFITGVEVGALDVSRIRLTNCWAGALPSHGFLIQDCSDVTLVNCIAVANAGHGVYLLPSLAPSDVKISSCTISGNSRDNSGVYSGIKIDNFVDDFTITSNTIKPIDGIPNTQKYGIEISGVDHTRYVITDNNLIGNTVGAMLNESAAGSKQIANNLGFKTSTQGGSSFNAETSKVVAHGLSVTPQASAITITLNSDPGAAVRFWVNDITATTFTVNADISTTVGFSWTATAES